MSEEYIRKADAVEALDGKIIVTGHKNADTVLQYMKDISNKIKSLKPVDVVQVVRCQNCKHVYCRIYHGWQEPIYTCTHLRSRWNTDNDLEVNPDGFCSYGERREE